jgi:hypothetical protein
VKVEFKYAGQSAVISGLTETRIALATNTLREATYFNGELGRPLLLRDPMAALYDVVVSDYKYRPRDRVAFRLWLEEQDRKFLTNLAVKSEVARKQLEELEARLAELNAERSKRMAPFYKARQEFFDYVYEDQYELNYLLDPVITVHPDEVSFEAFSRDESSYARLAAKYDLFKKIDAFECGTTNVDYSGKLYEQLARMRSYRATRLDIDPSGFTVGHSGGGGSDTVHKEKKIDLPESWLKGFLQVHATMTLGLTHLTLAPIDLFNIVKFIRHHKAHASPRALRWELTPDRPVKVVFEPWEQVIELSAASVYQGAKAQSVRTWGRDRLSTLSRLLHLVQKVDVYLAGFGMPSIYVCDLGDASFTLALSGWTDNDWTSGKAKFSLLSRRLDVTVEELTAVYEGLRAVRYSTAESLAGETGLGVEKTRSALSSLCQVGRGMYDLSGKVFRHRDLFHEPFSGKQVASLIKKSEETSDPKAKEAVQIQKAGNVRIIARRPVSTGYKLSGSARGEGKRVRPLLSVDHEGQIMEASCTCGYFRKYKLTKGPCEHILALRLAHMEKLEQEDKGGGS